MDVLDKVTAELSLSAAERQVLAGLMEAAEREAGAIAVPLDNQARLGLAAHLGSLVRRCAQGERLEGIDTTLFDEVPSDCMEAAGRLLEPLRECAGRPLDRAEIGLVALHFAAARERAGQSS